MLSLSLAGSQTSSPKPGASAGGGAAFVAAAGRTTDAPGEARQILDSYKKLAREKGAQAFAFALTHKEWGNLNDSEKKALTALVGDLLAGRIKLPSVRLAPRNPEPKGKPGEGDALFGGANGAFVSDGKGGGVILVGKDLSPQERAQTLAEEAGELLGAAAKARGVSVAKGDVGARLATMLAGGRPDESAFKPEQSDMTQVRLDGKVMDAQARSSQARASQAPNPIRLEISVLKGSVITLYSGADDYISKTRHFAVQDGSPKDLDGKRNGVIVASVQGGPDGKWSGTIRGRGIKTELHLAGTSRPTLKHYGSVKPKVVAENISPRGSKRLPKSRYDMLVVPSLGLPPLQDPDPNTIAEFRAYIDNYFSHDPHVFGGNPFLVNEMSREQAGYVRDHIRRIFDALSAVVAAVPNNPQLLNFRPLVEQVLLSRMLEEFDFVDGDLIIRNLNLLPPGLGQAPGSVLGAAPDVLQEAALNAARNITISSTNEDDLPAAAQHPSLIAYVLFLNAMNVQLSRARYGILQRASPEYSGSVRTEINNAIQYASHMVTTLPGMALYLLRGDLPIFPDEQSALQNLLTMANNNRMHPPPPPPIM